MARPSEAPRPVAPGPRSGLALRWRALRAFSLPLSALPALMALLAVAPPWRWRPLPAAAVLVGVPSLHLVGNLLNDYFDFLSGADRRTDADADRPGRLLVHGRLRPVDVLALAGVFAALALAAGGVLLWLRGWPVALAAGVAFAGAWAYTAPPAALKRRACGEGLIFLLFGPGLMIAAAWAYSGQWNLTAALLSVPVGLATTTVLVGNNLRDAEEDRAAGVLTLAHLADGRLSRALFVALPLAAVVGVAALAAAGAIGRGALAAPATLLLLRRPARAILAGQRLPDVDARTGRWATALFALSAVSQVLASLGV